MYFTIAGVKKIVRYIEVRYIEVPLYFGHSSKKDNHPGLLPQQGFNTSLQIKTRWALLGGLSRGFFTISGASNFKQLFMTFSGFGLLTMSELPCRVSHFVSILL